MESDTELEDDDDRSLGVRGLGGWFPSTKFTPSSARTRRPHSYMAMKKRSKNRVGEVREDKRRKRKGGGKEIDDK